MFKKSDLKDFFEWYAYPFSSNSTPNPDLASIEKHIRLVADNWAHPSDVAFRSLSKEQSLPKALSMEIRAIQNLYNKYPEATSIDIEKALKEYFNV